VQDGHGERMLCLSVQLRQFGAFGGASRLRRRKTADHAGFHRVRSVQETEPAIICSVDFYFRLKLNIEIIIHNINYFE